MITTTKTTLNRIINNSFRFLELSVFLVVFGFFGFFLVTLNRSCLSGICSKTFFGEGNLYFLTIKYIIPVVSILSLVRIGLDYYNNSKEVMKNWFFYISLVGVGSTVVAFGQVVKDFVYIYSPNDIQPESINVFWVLSLFAFSSLMLLHSKRSWDSLTFVGKSRVLFFVTTIIFLFNNMNLGVLYFVFGLPVLLVLELRKK